MAYITIINQFYTPDISPTAHLSASLAEHLAEEGHVVSVVTSRGGYTTDADSDSGKENLEEDEIENPKVYRMWTPRLGKSTILKRCIDYAAFYLLAFFRMISLPRQDVVISLTTPPYIAMAGVAHKLLHPSSKLVLWSMDCYPDAAERMDVIKKGRLLSRTMRWMNRLLFKRLDHLIVLDTAMQELLVSQYANANNPQETTTIPNWENASLFPNDAQHDKWSMASNYKLDDKFVVLYLGNTGYGHHFESTLRAAEQLRDEPVVFLFVGGGKRWQQLEEEKNKRNLDNVILHGYVPKEETPNVMTSADCALITLRDNSLGVMSPSKLHSNLAVNLPVIYLGPETSNVDDAIKRFECGVSLRTSDTDGLVSFIRENMSRGERFTTLRNNARRAFDEAYVDLKTLPQFSGIIGQLLNPCEEHSRSETVA